jgi:hypothetical protein
MPLPPAETLEKIRARTKEAMLRPEVQMKVKGVARVPKHTEETKVSEQQAWTVHSLPNSTA